LSIEPARVRGRLYLASAGYPVLVVPRSSILARGSADAVADLAAQSSARLPSAAAEGDGSVDVVGELMTFDHPRERLAAIDELEGFHPDRPSLYSRVLLTVRRAAGDSLAAWTYVEGDLLRGGRS
jgi:Gamma-glutamyl cyclotransferase, AIG2-like